MKKDCHQFISEISDYIDGEIDPKLCAEIEKHIGECDNCRIMVDSLRQTVRLVRDGRAEDLPADLAKRLNDAMKRRWQEKFRSGR